MITINQTKIGLKGNCLAACVASILEIPLDKIDFSCGDYEPGKWLEHFQEKIKPFGVYFEECTDLTSVKTFLEGEFFIATGKSLRKLRGSDGRLLLHSVVCKWEIDGVVEVVHDPHPDKTGLTEIWYYGLLISTEKK